MRKMKQYAGNIDNISEQNDDEQESYNRADYLKTFDLVKEEQVENLEKKIIIDDNSYHKKELLLLDYPNEEEPADPFSVHSSNNINAYIQFILKEDRSITIANIEATRFPWLYSEKKEFLQERLNEYIKAHKKNNSLYKINCLNVKKYIENILTYDLNQIEYNISFKFDSEWIDYFGKARDFFTISPEIEFINFDEELKRSSNEIAKLDCDTSEFILSHCIEFYKIRIKTDARGWLTSLRVYIDDDRNPVINQKLSTRIDKKDTFYTLYVNNISLKDYRRLSEKSIIHFEFDFEEKSITHSIEAKYDATSIPVNDNLVHLFMDMGSTYTKFIVAQSDLSGNILKIRRCIGPKPTSSYCESLSVDFDKKDRTESGTEAFGQWLVQSLRKISQEHYKRGEIIHSVVWSFPAINDKLNQMFYPTVSDIVNSHAGTFIYDEFILIPEHEALKYMFDHVLKTLARVGQNGIETINQKNTKIDLENAKSREVHNYKLRRYSDYQDRWWITKLFIDEVYHPGESVSYTHLTLPTKRIV